jgi:hypothetical protein
VEDEFRLVREALWLLAEADPGFRNNRGEERWCLSAAA